MPGDTPRLRIAVRVQPRSSRDRVVGRQGDSIKVQVKAPPVEGAANASVVDVLAEWLGIPRRCVSVSRGQSGRNKVVDVVLDDPGDLGRIERLLEGLVDSKNGAA